MPPSTSQVTRLLTRVVSLTFGGGSAIMAALQREMVERRQWLTHEQFGVCYGVSRITPGTNIFAFCTGAGWIFGTWRGALLALLAASIPCTGLMMLALVSYQAASGNAWLTAALRGAMAAAIGVILASIWAVLRPYLDGVHRHRNALLFVASGVMMIGLGLSPIPILVMAATIGFLLPGRRPA
ncbi:MAG: chromate transporter [Bryobacterales bacterium]|nr:chromate transporter [Bryobacterales bacterium]